MLANLECGYMIDSLEFAKDSLFCEWGYLVNLDENVLEVYRGFISEGEKVNGRFAGHEYRPDYREGRNNYEPISLLATIDLDLPTDQIKAALQTIEDNRHAEDE